MTIRPLSSRTTPGFGLVCLLTCSLLYVCIICIVLTDLLAHHDWLITNYACILLVKILFSHTFSKHEINRRTKPKTQYFSRFLNLPRKCPGKRGCLVTLDAHQFKCPMFFKIYFFILICGIIAKPVGIFLITNKVVY